MPTTVEYLRIAYITAATESDDPGTQNGAVLVPADIDDRRVSAANRLPTGIVCDLSKVDRDTKLQKIEHAERNVLQLAGKLGIATDGATMYVPWFACCPCARAIIGHGVKKVVGHRQMMDMTPERWRAEIIAADELLDEAGVEREYYDGPVSDPQFPIRLYFNGKLWTP
ncbi:MAG: deoxycytidylate deaminase [Planctomycetota bacterium]|jgi:deoxycytidylate deaminase